jgi:hypothetical protein
MEEIKLREKDKDLVFRQNDDDIGLHDLDAQEKKTERHQAILKQKYSE